MKDRVQKAWPARGERKPSVANAEGGTRQAGMARGQWTLCFKTLRRIWRESSVGKKQSTCHVGMRTCIWAQEPMYKAQEGKIPVTIAILRWNERQRQESSWKLVSQVTWCRQWRTRDSMSHKVEGKIWLIPEGVLYVHTMACACLNITTQPTKKKL